LKIRRLSLTVFFIILTLSIGPTAINLQSSAFNPAFALENKINDAIKKACPSYENSNSIKEVLPNALRACLEEGMSSNPPPTSPPPNGAKAHLTIQVWPLIPTSECSFDNCIGKVYGTLNFRDYSDFSNSFSETLTVPSNPPYSTFEREILIGGKYDVSFEPDRKHTVHFTDIISDECGNITEIRGGKSICDGIKGPGNSHVFIGPIFLSFRP
jgi:hypothetical protein